MPQVYLQRTATREVLLAGRESRGELIDLRNAFLIGERTDVSQREPCLFCVANSLTVQPNVCNSTSGLSMKDTLTVGYRECSERHLSLKSGWRWLVGCGES